MNNYIEIFDTLLQFAKVDGRANDPFFEKFACSKDNTADYVKFSGTNNYLEAERLMLEGDKESARMITENMTRLKDNGQITRNTTYSAQQGFIPNMGRVMTGHPENMINVRRQICKNTKVVNIFANVRVSCGMKAAEAARRGALVLSYINGLEKNGYRVNLYVGQISKFQDSKNTAGLAVKVKDSGKPLNVTKVAFPLVNPSFFRRICFRWIETTGQTKDFGYGCEQRKEIVLKVLRDSGKMKNFHLLCTSDINTSEDIEKQMKENVI